MSRRAVAAALAIALVLAACGTEPPGPTAAPTPEPTVEPTPEPRAEDMAAVCGLLPGLYADLRYATAENFTGEAIYDDAEPYLRRGTAEKLAMAMSELAEQGYGLCIWDGWRPVAAQFALWRACPDARYVSDPFGGLTNHCRGNTVDVTLVTPEGGPVEMPSGFDDFTPLADRDYSDVSAEAAEHAEILEAAMERAGFEGYWNEWWHYTDSESYELCESLTELPTATAECEEYLTLRAAPDPNAEAMGTVPAGAVVTVLDDLGSYALVRFGESRGYVMGAYLQYEGRP